MGRRVLPAVLLVGLVPALMVGAGAVATLRTSSGASMAPPASGGAGASPEARLEEILRGLESSAAALAAAWKRHQGDVAALASTPSQEAFRAYLDAHEGVRGILQVSPAGEVELQVPPGSVADASFGGTAEFRSLKERLADPSKPWPYTFYSHRLGEGTFVFAHPTPGGSLVAVVLRIGHFLKSGGVGGDVLLLVPSSGAVLHHPEGARLLSTFNEEQDPALSRILSDLREGRGGTLLEPGRRVAAWTPLGVGTLGVVHLVPWASVRAASAPSGPPAAFDPLALVHSPLGLSLVVALAWMLLAGALLGRSGRGPLEEAERLLASATEGGETSDAARVAALKDADVRNLMQRAVAWAARLASERDALGVEKDRQIQAAKAQLADQAKQLQEAADRLGTVRTQLEETKRQLAEKLQELEAQKGMAAGLRTQVEKGQAEVARFKGEAARAEREAEEKGNRLKEAEAKLHDLEAKLMQALAQASSVQVSKVRVAAIRTMAEELKTTLGIIKGYVSSALGSAVGGITEKQQEFLGMVINRSARLEKFINDLVDIFQVEIEQEEAPRETVPVAAQIEAQSFNFQSQAEIKSLKIKVEEKGKVPPVPVVKRRFTQLWNVVFLQLIKDAPRGATLEIVVEPFAGGVKVSVHDPGLTVAPEHLPTLFDEFYDPKHPASPQLAGTGLKFALVKTIVAAHGGAATAEKAETGTRWIFTFPTEKEKKGATPPPPTAAVPRAASPPAAPKPAAPAPPAGLPPGAKPPAAPGGAPPRPAGVPSLDDLLQKKGTAAPGKPGFLDALLKKKEGALGAPSVPPGAPPPGPGFKIPGAPAKPPVSPVSSPPSAAVPDLDALLSKKPAPSPAAPAPSSVPASGDKSGEKRQVQPPPPPPPAAPPPSGPPAPSKVVPTSLRPTKPPPGILDFDTQDTFKLDQGAGAKPITPSPPAAGGPKAPPPSAVPLSPPGGVPKPPRPGAPGPGGAGPGKPITRDLKDTGGEGELLE